MESYICKRIKDVNDRWRDAGSVMLTRNSDGRPPRFSTEARLVYDDERLYVSFLCDDDRFLATMTGFNDTIYLEDVVEVFIDDDCDRKTYIEIEISPINTVLHYLIQNDLAGRFIGFARVDQCVHSHVETEETGPSRMKWHAEFSIPLHEFITAPNIPPLPGDQWLFNLYRIKQGRAGEECSYSNTKRDSFHHPSCFVPLVFE
ncbi:MAG: carbohydrate-binding family 9-like protein [Clostridia bacterium]|nr:carbohydrate-binding family 9-like protein [Clostridia bacterium]